MTVTATGSTGSQSLTNQVLAQLLSGSNAQATSGLTPTVLEAVLKNLGSGSSASSGSSSTGKLPDDVMQALGDLLSGSQSSSSASDLATVQNYFKSNPTQLASLLGGLEGGTGYTSSGTLTPASALLSALSGSGSGTGNAALLTALAGQTSGGSQSALLAALLQGSSQDPLLASLGGSSDSSLSLLG